MRPRLNCWLVAMWLWWTRRHARNYAWVRRSEAFGGLIPHFGYAELTEDGHLLVIDYIPPKGRLWSKDNFILAFKGSYRATLFHRESSRTFQTLTEATEWAGTWPSLKVYCTECLSDQPSGSPSASHGVCSHDDPG